MFGANKSTAFSGFGGTCKFSFIYFLYKMFDNFLLKFSKIVLPFLGAIYCIITVFYEWLIQFLVFYFSFCSFFKFYFSSASFGSFGSCKLCLLFIILCFFKGLGKSSKAYREREAEGKKKRGVIALRTFPGGGRGVEEYTPLQLAFLILFKNICSFVLIHIFQGTTFYKMKSFYKNHISLRKYLHNAGLPLFRRFKKMSFFRLKIKIKSFLFE